MPSKKKIEINGTPYVAKNIGRVPLIPIVLNTSVEK